MSSNCPIAHNQKIATRILFLLVLLAVIIYGKVLKAAFTLNETVGNERSHDHLRPEVKNGKILPYNLILKEDLTEEWEE